MKYFLLTFFLAVNSVATTYYIDWEGGTDANDGRSKATPWKSHPFMATFKGGYKHQSGDQFIFKGGVTWPSACLTWIIKVGGTAGSTDYYGVDQSWFSGNAWSRPVLDAESSRQALVFFGTLNPYAATTHYVTFDGFDLRNLYWTGSQPYGSVYFISFADGTHDIQIQNCYIHDWTHGALTSKTTDRLICILGESIKPWNASCTISNCVIDGGGRNSTDFQSSGWGIGPWGGKILNCTIRNCVSCVMAGYSSEIGFSDLGPSWNSFDPNQHDNIINTIFGGTQLIHDNYIHDGKSVNILMGGNGGETDYVWNNVIWGCTQNFAISIDDYTGTKAFIFNNTIASAPKGAIRVVKVLGGTPDTVSAVDNHVIYSGSLIQFDSGVSASHVINESNVSISPDQATFEGYTASNRFRPPSASGSSVVRGKDLSQVLGGRLVNDILGTPRAVSTGWNVGAYQYVGGSAPGQVASPGVPGNSSPGDGATGVALTTTLVGGDFSDASGNGQSGSEWLILDGAGGSTVWDSGVLGASTVVNVPAGTLAYSTRYSWKVRYQSASGLWSSYSSSTSFTTCDPPAQPPSPDPGSGPSGATLTFQATDGVLAAPFVLNGGTIAQSQETTDPSMGGEVTFSFTAAQDGSYAVSMLVNGPAENSNSLFVDIDEEPAAPAAIWDISPVTSGFEWRTVSWRGDQGAPNQPQFSPKFWQLKAGAHTLYVRGRESNTSLQSVSLQRRPNPPSNLRIADAQP